MFAISQERTILTLNRKHCIKLHKANPNHEGIIVCTFDPDFKGQAKRIHDAIHLENKLDRKLIKINRLPK